MRLPCVRCRGMTLMELLIALALGASLSAVVMQLFTGSMHLQSVQRSEQDLQQRAAYAQFILRAGIRGSVAGCATGDTGTATAPGHGIEILAADTGAVNALTGSQVLRLRTGDCEEPVHFLYIARRSGRDDQPAGLYRRRQHSDGTFSVAEELIEGVTAMTATLGVKVLPAAQRQASAPVSETVSEPKVTYICAGQVSDWSRVFSVNLTLSVQPVTMGGTVSGDGLTMTFSTALRQTELHRPGQGAG